MEQWRKVWREGIAPHLSTNGLRALAEALRTDDSRLLQGATTAPPPLACVQDWPIEAACVIGHAGTADLGGFDGERPATVGEVVEFFARVCFEADLLMGEPAAYRWFLNWYDDTPREVMRAALLREVRRTLRLREHEYADIGGEG